MNSGQKCQCPYDQVVTDAVSRSRYNPVTERSFLNHKPGECQCQNDLRQYDRDGKILWLCSCCVLLGDVPINQKKGGE